MKTDLIQLANSKIQIYVNPVDGKLTIYQEGGFVVENFVVLKPVEAMQILAFMAQHYVQLALDNPNEG